MEKKEKLNKKDKKIVKRVFKDNEKYHPKKPVAKVVPFIKKRVLPPVWPSVHLINAKLKEFCSKHDSITFFDATSIFATNEGPGGHRLKNELISPGVTPRRTGSPCGRGTSWGGCSSCSTRGPRQSRRPRRRTTAIARRSPPRGKTAIARCPGRETAAARCPRRKTAAARMQTRRPPRKAATARTMCPRERKRRYPRRRNNQVVPRLPRARIPP